MIITSLRLMIILRVLRMIWGVIVAVGKAMLTALISLSRGLPETLDDIANEWTNRSDGEGINTTISPTLYRIYWWTALTVTVIGYILLAHVVVFLIALIF